MAQKQSLQVNIAILKSPQYELLHMCHVIICQISTNTEEDPTGSAQDNF